MYLVQFNGRNEVLLETVIWDFADLNVWWIHCLFLCKLLFFINQVLFWRVLSGVGECFETQFWISLCKMFVLNVLCIDLFVIVFYKV